MSRISYRNLVPLNYLKPSFNYGDRIFCESKDARLRGRLDYISSSLACFGHLLSSRVWAVSENFAKAALKSAPNLRQSILNEVKDNALNSYCGTLLYKGKVYMYSFQFSHFGQPDICFVAEFDKLGNIQHYGHCGLDGFGFDSPSDHKYGGFPDEQTERVWLSSLAWDILTFIFFERYAKVEIIESKARTKLHAQGCKYLNETDLDIRYLDSKWFTTLVNSKGFKVGGHFRLQPKKKDGEWTKELIWIDDFEKKGYNRKAGILKTE